MTKARLEAFSDGVFAVAITLLVLDLHVEGPGPGHPGLFDQLTGEWPRFAAYVVSFAVIGIIWVNHHALFGHVARVDRPLLFVNLLVLLFVGAIPFTTSTLAQYLDTGGANSHLAAALYSAVMEAMGVSIAILYRLSIAETRIRPGIDAAVARRAYRRFGLGSFVYLPTIALAFLSAPLTLAVHAVLAVFYIFNRAALVDDTPVDAGV